MVSQFQIKITFHLHIRFWDCISLINPQVFDIFRGLNILTLRMSGVCASLGFCPWKQNEIKLVRPKFFRLSKIQNKQQILFSTYNFDFKIFTFGLFQYYVTYLTTDTMLIYLKNQFLLCLNIFWASLNVSPIVLPTNCYVANCFAAKFFLGPRNVLVIVKIPLMSNFGACLQSTLT